MTGRSWTRQELLRVLKLYCEIPFGKMHYRNEKVVAVASQINRTPSSVALKLVNFASLDKAHQSRGIAGMSNSSKLDKKIWDEVQDNWNLLVDLSTSDNQTTDFIEKKWEGETSITALAKVRRGQQFFRSCVLAAYNFECALTKIRSPELLRASHIIPWHRQEKTRVEPRNGICLNALHDAAFDRGLLTFDEKLRLVLSEKVKEQMPELAFNQMFKIYQGRQLNLPRRFIPPREYFDFHRSKVFDVAQ